MGGTTGDLLGTGNTGGGYFGGPDTSVGPRQMTGADYNRRLQAGESSQTIRGSQAGLSDNQFNDIVTQAGMQSPTGRPLAGSAQFFQPVYQSQYQNLNTGNRMGVSQYGQQPSFGGGFGGGFSGGFGGGFTPQMQQPTMFGGQMQGGGYGQFGMNNPFSPFSNSFLNLDPNLNQGTQADKANAYRSAIQNGFGDQQIYNQATGLFGQQSPQAWSYLQNQAFPAQQSGGFMPQMQTPFQQPMQQAQSPFRSSGPSQAIVGRSSQMRGTPNVMRRAQGGITSLLDET